MGSFVTQFAVEQSGNIFSALGIDWQMLIFQIIGFLLLVFVMGKWVYPVLVKTLDAREEKINAGAKAAAEAEAKAKEASLKVDKMLKEARKTAADIVATAHDEAQNTLTQADKKAKTSAELVLKNAHEQVEKDIAQARKMLHDDTVKLVAAATEKVVGASLDKKTDEKLIKQSLEEAK